MWVGDRLVDMAQARVSALDHGVTVGDGVFETMKVVHGRPFALRRHLDRMERSAAGLGLPLDRAAVIEAIDAVLHDAGASEGLRLRVTLTGGPSPLGSDRGTGPTTLLAAVAPAGRWPASTDLAVVPWVRNERSAVAGLKTTSYAENVVALHVAHDRGAGEALFANTVGNICEGTGSHVFLGIGGRLVTPPLSAGPLPGVTRDLVLEWVRGIDEVDVPLAELGSVDEAFITSSTRDVQPVRAIDGRVLPGGAPGPLTRHAMEVWAVRSVEHVDP
jgi:branched-chain amino acid aminotransferase